MKVALTESKSQRLTGVPATDGKPEYLPQLFLTIQYYVSSTQSKTEKFNGYKLWQLLKQKYAGNDLTSRST
jgi:hypothetical protein